MDRNLPARTMRLFGREARVLEPSSVDKLVRTIWQIAPGHRGDRVDHTPESSLRVLDLLEHRDRHCAFGHGADDSMAPPTFLSTVRAGGAARVLSARRRGGPCSRRRKADRGAGGPGGSDGL